MEEKQTKPKTAHPYISAGLGIAGAVMGLWGVLDFRDAYVIRKDIRDHQRFTQNPDVALRYEAMERDELILFAEMNRLRQSIPHLEASFSTNLQPLVYAAYSNDYAKIERINQAGRKLSEEMQELNSSRELRNYREELRKKEKDFSNNMYNGLFWSMLSLISLGLRKYLF